MAERAGGRVGGGGERERAREREREREREEGVRRRESGDREGGLVRIASHCVALM